MPLVRCAGADERRAQALSRELAGRGCTALAAFGMAGALDPALRSGDVVLAETVIAGKAVFVAESAWLRRIHTILRNELRVVVAPVAGSSGIVATAEAKRSLRASSLAVAVDMESHAVAAVAAELGLPFLCARVIADTADQAIPMWIPATLDADGRPRMMSVLRRLARNPGDIGVVAGLAMAETRAMRSLRRVASLLGPRFGRG